MFNRIKVKERGAGRKNKGAHQSKGEARGRKEKREEREGRGRKRGTEEEGRKQGGSKGGRNNCWNMEKTLISLIQLRPTLYTLGILYILFQPSNQTISLIRKKDWNLGKLVKFHPNEEFY